MLETAGLSTKFLKKEMNDLPGKYLLLPGYCVKIMQELFLYKF